MKPTIKTGLLLLFTGYWLRGRWVLDKDFARSEILIEEDPGTGVCGRERNWERVKVMRKILEKSKSCGTANIRGGGVDAISASKRETQGHFPY